MNTWMIVIITLAAVLVYSLLVFKVLVHDWLTLDHFTKDQVNKKLYEDLIADPTSEVQTALVLHAMVVFFKSEEVIYKRKRIIRACLTLGISLIDDYPNEIERRFKDVRYEATIKPIRTILHKRYSDTLTQLFENGFDGHVINEILDVGQHIINIDTENADNLGLRQIRMTSEKIVSDIIQATSIPDQNTIEVLHERKLITKKELTQLQKKISASGD
jgi:hypothetical protein